jgi:hypothetical protein
MNDALREALLQSGLATREQAVKAEKSRSRKQQEQREQHIRERIQRYPKNRYGNPYYYARWFVTKRVPKNCAKICALCGEHGKPAYDATLELMDKFLLGSVEDALLHLDKIKGEVLVPLDLFSFSGGRTKDLFNEHHTHSCKMCLEHHIRRLFG